MSNLFCLFMTKSEDKEVTVKPVEKSGRHSGGTSHGC